MLYADRGVTYAAEVALALCARGAAGVVVVGDGEGLGAADERISNARYRSFPDEFGLLSGVPEPRRSIIITRSVIGEAPDPDGSER